MPKYRVLHNNHYSFQETVSHCQIEARLQPQDTQNQTVEFSQFVVRPLADSHRVRQDMFGNQVNLFEITQPLQSFELSAIHTVTISPSAQLDIAASMPWEKAVEMASTDDQVKPFLDEFHDNGYTAHDNLMNDYARVSFLPGRPLLQAAQDLMQRIHDDFHYDPRATSVQTTAIEAFRLQRGVCQDFSHIAIACLLSLKLPVRYVSGYVDTQSASGGQNRRLTVDVSHAWFSVFEPNNGWVDFDPTNNQIPGETYITVAHGRDYRDIAPLKGMVDTDGQNTLRVSVHVDPIS